MKTAQDSYTITIKQIVRFQERMLEVSGEDASEKFHVDKIPNGRLSAIIYLDRPDIVEYHENRSRYLHHYSKTNQERMHFEKNQLVQVQNGRQSAIIHFHMAVIW